MKIINIGILKILILLFIITSCGKDEKLEKEENKEPVCKIIAPIENDTIQSGDVVMISAEADDEDGNITEVRFYINEVGVGSSTIFPYQYNWNTNEEEVGEHFIKVVAKDNEGSDSFDERRICIIGLPTDANAGEDKVFTNSETSTTLEGNEPTPYHGKGEWTIISGEGGHFENKNIHNTLFTGLACHSYILRWTISTQFNSSYDDIKISFEHTPTNADAGENQIYSDGRTSSSLNANTPESEQGTGIWTIVSGSGGSIDDITNPKAIFSGILYEQYVLRWSITTDCSASSDEITVYYTEQLTDIDGNSYNIVKVGEQFWMAENLKVTHYSNGSAIENATSSSRWESLWNDQKAYCFYNNNESLGYGALYTYAAAVNGTPYDGTNHVQGVCPDGWHIPSDAEWTELENYLISNGYNYDGTNIGNKIAKSLASNTDWSNSDIVGTVGYEQGKNNITGFTGLPAGERSATGSFYFLKSYGYWWASNKNGSYAYCRFLYNRYAKFDNKYVLQKSGLSVRCVKD